MRALLLAAACCGTTLAATAPSGVPFYKDALPVLQKNCQNGHRPGEAAPMSFLDYQHARPWAKSIKAAVLSEKMPPAWAGSGAKEGNPKDAPAPVTFTEGWQIGKPDYVIEMPKEFSVPANGTIEAEARPGNRAAVHHIIAFIREPGNPFLKDAKPGGLFVPDKNSGGAFADSLAGYAPGMVPQVLKPGQVKLLNQELAIPPGDLNYEVNAKLNLPHDATLVNLLLHMHVRGKDFEYRAIYPSGETETLLRVPKYDFNWQLTYYLAQQKLLPAGTIFECTAHYDNSLNNKYNPDPTKEVHYGDQTWEEMMFGFFDVAIPMDASVMDLLRPKRPAAWQTGAGL